MAGRTRYSTAENQYERLINHTNWVEQHTDVLGASDVLVIIRDAAAPDRFLDLELERVIVRLGDLWLDAQRPDLAL